MELLCQLLPVFLSLLGQSNFSSGFVIAIIKFKNLYVKTGTRCGDN
jgi:hypothetical protein